MEIPLREVRFQLLNYEYLPDARQAEIEEMNNLTKERMGYFHCWTNDVDTSKDLPFIKKMALIEDIETGEIHMVEYTKFKFVNYK